MRRIVVVNQKGGVGKTTTCANLGAALALLGRRVVLVDMDAQANLSTHLGLQGASERSTYGLLTGRCSFAEALVPTRVDGLALVPSHLDLSGAELELASALARESLLAQAVDEWAGARAADYVIVDCPPSLGLLSINALVAAREVFIALQTEYFALEGMSRLVEVVQLLRKRMRPDLEITGILPTLYDNRLRLAREVLAEIRTYFPGQVFENAVRTNVRLAEAPSHGQTIFEYAPESYGARDHLLVALEVIAQEGRDAELAQRPRPGTRAADELLRRLVREARARPADEAPPGGAEPVRARDLPPLPKEPFGAGSRGA